MGLPEGRRISPVVAVLALILPSMWVGSTWAHASHPALSAYCSAGNVVCITSDRPSRMDVTASNRIYDGQGHTVPGITVNADNVTVQNFRFTNCAGNCVWIKGTGNTVQDNHISQVYYAGDDIDGLRFFGNDTKILRNTFRDILKGPKNDAHLDCMQTYATPSAGGGSSNVVIEGNDCRDPAFHQCLMVEGPGSTDGGGGGGGATRNWVIRGNYFQCYANQTIALRDAHDAVVQHNHFAGRGNKAVQQADGTSGITISNNVLGSGYRNLTGD
jgi:Right handed beta helix region